MESGLFENYEQEFNTLFSSIANKINIIVPSQSGEKKKEILRGLEREFREADEVLGQMEVELHSLPAQARAKLQPRLRGYKTEIEKQRKEFVCKLCNFRGKQAAGVGAVQTEKSCWQAVKHQLHQLRMTMALMIRDPDYWQGRSD